METTEMMIEEIVGAIAGPMSSRRQTHYLRESLRHLVRVAKSEQTKDVQRCVALSIGTPAAVSARKGKNSARRFVTALLSGQGRLNFETHAPE